MKMVPGIDAGRKGVGMLWVSDCGLEVNYAIKSSAGPDPVVDGFANGLALLGVIARTMVRRQSTADDGNAVGVRAQDHLAERKNEISGCQPGVRGGMQAANV